MQIQLLNTIMKKNEDFLGYTLYSYYYYYYMNKTPPYATKLISKA